MADASSPILPQGAGYGVVVGIGIGFSLFMLAISYMQQRYTNLKLSKAEEFTSASRSVKPGLIASGIVSAWTWAATLLQSSAVAYQYGISGPFWYASGATIQILLFAQIAAKAKLNAPNAHTWLEVIKVRWGTFAHLVFLFFSLATNILVSSMLITGASATVTDLTGMSTQAACFMIPIFVGIYVVFGGLRATFFADYIHTAVLIAIILTFFFSAYATSEKIGSPQRMYELLVLAAEKNPVPGNAHGSYVTMRSKDGLIFGVVNVIGNFGTVLLDQAYFQRAVASNPATAVKGFLLGGLSWFAVPFLMSSTLGLAAVALTAAGDPAMTVLSKADVSAGLPAPAAAAALLGKSGAAAMLVLLFLAVTSATSAEIIAVSSVLTYDVYKTYFNPKATQQQVFWWSHAFIAFWSIFMGVLGIIWFYSGVSMGYLYLAMGCIIGGGVPGMAFAFLWDRTNKIGAITGAIGGLVLGVASWFACAGGLYGSLSLEATGQTYPTLTGNVVSICTSLIIVLVSTWIWPQRFDWDKTRAINAANAAISVEGPPADNSTPSSVHVRPAGEKGQHGSSDDVDAEKAGTATASVDMVGVDAGEDQQKNGSQTRINIDEVFRLAGLDRVALDRAFKIALWWSLALTLIMLIIIPLPLFFTSHIYPEAGFAAWVSIGCTWIFLSAIIVVIYPLWESRRGLWKILGGVLKDVFLLGGGGKKSKPTGASSHVA